MTKHVLLISYIALMDSTPNGRTMKSLLEGIPASSISLFTVSGIPDEKSCSSAYKITNSDVLKSLLPWEKIGKLYQGTDLKGAQQRNVLNSIQGEKTAWKYLGRELLWKYAPWKKKALRDWLKKQNIDYVVYMYGDSPSLQNFAIYVSRYLGVPLIVYSCENYYFKHYNYLDGKKYSLWFWLYHRMSKNATRRLFSQASGLICNSQELGELYQSEFLIKNYETIMMASNIETNCSNYDVKSLNETEVVYLGSLGHNRVDALLVLANTLQSIDSSLRLSVYGAANEDVRQILMTNPGILYKGSVPYEKVPNIIRNAALNIEVITMNAVNAKNKKYGLSTKFADALSSGTPFLIYAPSEMVETQLANKYRAAFVITEDINPVDVMKRALFDQGARKEQLENANILRSTFFDKEKNIKKYNNLIAKLYAD